MLRLSLRLLLLRIAVGAVDLDDRHGLFTDSFLRTFSVW